MSVAVAEGMYSSILVQAAGGSIQDLHTLPLSPSNKCLAVLSDLILNPTQYSVLADLRGDEARCMADFLTQVSLLVVDYLLPNAMYIHRLLRMMTALCTGREGTF